MIGICMLAVTKSYDFLADALTEIFRAASKHPNSRVSKLIHTVEDEPTQKNIVLLLIELAEHAEYSTDFNVSLKYVSCINLN